MSEEKLLGYLHQYLDEVHSMYSEDSEIARALTDSAMKEYEEMVGNMCEELKKSYENEYGKLLSKLHSPYIIKSETDYTDAYAKLADDGCPLTNDGEYPTYNNHRTEAKMGQSGSAYGSSYSTPDANQMGRTSAGEVYVGSPTADNAIAAAIGKAVRNAKRIARRDHIKADRIEGVNQFIVCLRREFSYLKDMNDSVKSELSHSLARKEIWYDIGVLHSTIQSYYCKYPRQQIQKWLDTAERFIRGTDSQKADIEADMEELSSFIQGATACVEQAKRINEASEQVEGQLVELLVN